MNTVSQIPHTSYSSSILASIINSGAHLSVHEIWSALRKNPEMGRLAQATVRSNLHSLVKANLIDVIPRREGGNLYGRPGHSHAIDLNTGRAVDLIDPLDSEYSIGDILRPSIQQLFLPETTLLVYGVLK